MIKKILIGVGILLLAIVLYVAYLFLFPASPRKEASFIEGGLEIKVSYGQPSKKGRLIFGEASKKALQPYGKYWRLGANAATEISFNKDVTFAGKPVKAGTYRMYAVPGPTSFQVSLNSELGVFLGVNEPNYKLDVLKVDVPTATSQEKEKFEISFSGDGTAVNMDFNWDTTLIRIPITIQ